MIKLAYELEVGTKFSTPNATGVYEVLPGTAPVDGSTTDTYRIPVRRIATNQVTSVSPRAKVEVI